MAPPQMESQATTQERAPTPTRETHHRTAALMFDQITAEPGAWDNKHARGIPVIRVYKSLPYGGKVTIAAVPYDQARRLADQLHDACDAYESEQRKRVHSDR